MSNPFANAGVNYANAVKVGGSGTGIQIFPAPVTNYNVASTVPAAVLLQAQQQGQIVSVKAAGSILTYGGTVNFVIQNGTSLTASSNTTILTLTSAQTLAAGSPPGTAYPFAIELDLQGDEASGIVQVVSGRIVCDGVSGTVTTTSLTGVNWSGANQFYSNAAPVSLVAGVQFNTGNASNAASLFQFEAA